MFTHVLATWQRQHLRRAWLCLVGALILTSGCAPAPSIVKVGLIAPFEGLYRESGYVALAAMRTAIVDCAPPGMDVVPLALDDSADPAKAMRAAEKLLVDPAVIAVIGPMTPATIAAVEPVLGNQARPWIAPPTVDPAGTFATPASSAWADELIAAAHQDQPTGRIFIVGLPANLATDWMGNGRSIRIEERADLAALAKTLTPDDGVLWWGDAAQGAAWLNEQRAAGASSAFWLANSVGGDVFVAHLTPQTDGSAAVGQNTYWLVWGHSDYNQQVRIDAPELPIAALTYTATCTALHDAAGVASTPPRSSSFAWEVQHRYLGAGLEPAP